MSKVYKEVIAILSSLSKNDLADVALKLAQDQPEVFLTIVRDEGVYRDIAMFFDDNEHSAVECVKEVRRVLTIGLKDAKDIFAFSVRDLAVEFGSETTKGHAEKIKHQYLSIPYYGG